VTSTIILSGCTLSNSKWTGFYYPVDEEGNSLEYIISPKDAFNTFDECADWIDQQQYIRNYPHGDDWECGSNCEWENNLYMMCEETRDY